MNTDQILIVDDDSLTLQVLSSMLEGGGFKPKCYSKPLEALAAIELDHPDVIISDYMMPEVNGIALLDLSVAMSPDSARILCTASTDFDVAMQAINTGKVHRIVTKPVRRDDFLSTVNQAAETVRLRRRNGELTEALRRSNLHLESIVRERTEALIQGFVCSLDARDSGTQWHSRRVAKYTRLLAARVGITEPDLTIVERGGLLHDIGKIGVPDSILLKKGPLSDDDWHQMRRHPEIGWGLLQQVDYLRVASSIVLQHHERWDGTGYPARISGEQIVLGARVFQVVDSYDAMTTDRPYRPRMSHDQACQQLAGVAGKQLDPEVVQAFLSVDPEEWLFLQRKVDHLAQHGGHTFGN
jgi:putative nucleotidyltransferase with HDIG domain